MVQEIIHPQDSLCHSLLPLQIVTYQTALYLQQQLPDTAGAGETSASCEPPSHTLIGAGWQVDGLQPQSVSQWPLDPFTAF